MTSHGTIPLALSILLGTSAVAAPAGAQDYGAPLALAHEGVTRVTTVSADTARHYEEESREGDPDAVTGPRREVELVASGVRLLP